MFTRQVNCSCSLVMFTSWFHVHIDPEVDLHGYHQRFLRRFHQEDHRKYLQKLLQRHQSGFTQRLHHHFHLCVINIILNGILKGIILASLRVIDGGFCPGNELLTLRRGLRHSRYVFLSNRLLELGIGYWASGIGFRLQFPVASNAAFTPYPVPVGLSKTSTARKSTSS